ncbi:MAG TPA: hypothetical protein VMV79_08040 [Alphaproteobacteria bacterium]|nr:hypothetical protein [Alphaproteobacteria bacterium]
MNVTPQIMDEERQRRRRARSWAIFLTLTGFALLIYAVTIVKIKLGYAP